jgi:S1-C subfamily serine protease
MPLTLYKFDEEGNEIGYVKYDSIVKEVDENTDVAVLKIVSKEMPTDEATLSTEKVKYGDVVYTIGQPLGFLQTINQGFITKPIFPFQKVKAIVFSAYINKGSSGGGLYNNKGDLIGLTNWGIPGGPYLASPVENLIKLLKVVND